MAAEHTLSSVLKRHVARLKLGGEEAGAPIPVVDRSALQKDLEIAIKRGTHTFYICLSLMAGLIVMSMVIAVFTDSEAIKAGVFGASGIVSAASFYKLMDAWRQKSFMDLYIVIVKFSSDNELRKMTNVLAAKL